MAELKFKGGNAPPELKLGELSGESHASAKILTSFRFSGLFQLSFGNKRRGPFLGALSSRLPSPLGLFAFVEVDARLNTSRTRDSS